MSVEFIYEDAFTAAVGDLLDDAAMESVELLLLSRPRAGVVIPGLGGARKLRVALPGRGKRGGARVVYVYYDVRETVHFLWAYAKNAQADLTTDQKRYVRSIIARIREGA